MIKELWFKYSYTIILIILSAAALFVISQFSKCSDQDRYLTVTVEQGDSLWALSMEYDEKHSLSSEQFISWVEKKNGIINGVIYPGDSLLIPVKREQSSHSQYAGE